MKPEEYYRQLAELLSETPADCRDRERTAFDRCIAPYDGNIVIFGAGRLGKKLVDVLRSTGKTPLAFADNNKALWGQKIEGIEVYSPAEAAAKFGSTSVFVVAIFAAEASGRFEDRVSELKALGCQSVAPFGIVLWQVPSSLPHWAADLPSRILEQHDAIRRCADLWSDASSRAEYIAQLRWRLLFDFESLPHASRSSQYFPDVVQLSDSETFVDCGAYDGDSLRLFMHATGGQFRRAICFEPDPSNFQELQAFVQQLAPATRERIDVHQAAVADSVGELCFTATGGTGARLGDGELIVRSVTLDSQLQDAQPTYVKMDIEGAELTAITGARQTIMQHHPAFAVCAYHTPDHLWKIPLLVHSMRPEYQFFLRAYKEVWELVCYAVPGSRVKVSAAS